MATELTVAVACPNVVRHDGQGRATLELVRALVGRGHRVVVHAHRLDRELAGSVDHRPLPALPGPELPRMVVTEVAATRALRRSDHDVAVLVGATAAPDRRPYVVAAHFSHRGWRRTWRPERRPGPYHRAHARLSEALEQRLVAGAACVLAPSSSVHGDLGVPADRSVVAANGVDLDELAPATAQGRAAARRQLGLAADAWVLGFIGEHHTGRKGLDALLVALARGHGDEMLVVAGSGSRRALGAEVDRLGLAGRVVVPGFLAASTVLAAVDAAVVPSRYEPFSLVALEAAASGVPVVISEAAGARAVLGDAVLTVADPDDEAGLRAALEVVRHDAARRSVMVAAGLEAVRELSWTSTMIPAVEAIEAVAERRSPVLVDR